MAPKATASGRSCHGKTSRALCLGLGGGQSPRPLRRPLTGEGRRAWLAGLFRPAGSWRSAWHPPQAEGSSPPLPKARALLGAQESLTTVTPLFSVGEGSKPGCRRRLGEDPNYGIYSDPFGGSSHTPTLPQTSVQFIPTRALVEVCGAGVVIRKHFVAKTCYQPAW